MLNLSRKSLKKEKQGSGRDEDRTYVLSFYIIVTQYYYEVTTWLTYKM